MPPGVISCSVNFNKGEKSLGRKSRKTLHNARLNSEAPRLLRRPGVAGDSWYLRHLLHWRVPREAGGGQVILEGGGPGTTLSSVCHQSVLYFTFQGIYCVGSILGTGAGLTAFIFMISNSIKDKFDDDDT